MGIGVINPYANTAKPNGTVATAARSSGNKLYSWPDGTLRPNPPPANNPINPSITATGSAVGGRGGISAGANGIKNTNIGGAKPFDAYGTTNAAFGVKPAVDPMGGMLGGGVYADPQWSAYNTEINNALVRDPAGTKGWFDPKPAGMSSFDYWKQHRTDPPPGSSGTGSYGGSGGGQGVNSPSAATSNMSSVLQTLIDNFNKNKLGRESSQYYKPLQDAILNPSYNPTSASEQALLNSLKDQTQGASATRGLGPATQAGLAQAIAPTLVDLRQKHIADLQNVYANDMNNLVTQRGQDLQQQLGQLGIGAQLRNQDLVNALGWGGIDMQKYGIDKNYALGAGGLSLRNVLALMQANAGQNITG